MGRFDGYLLVSDFDRTLLYTGRDMSPDIARLHPRDEAGLAAWMAEGGRFAIATGRAMGSFRRYLHVVPMDAPTIVDNGSAIYDYGKQEFLFTSLLPEAILPQLQALHREMPQLPMEIYHGHTHVQVLNPSPWNTEIFKITDLRREDITDLEGDTVPLPISKVLFVGEHAMLEEACRRAERAGWFGDYEIVFSNLQLLEITQKGANKGVLARRLMADLGCSRLVCAGDNLNDLAMLRAADYAFCPANAVPDLQAEPGVETVCHCLEGAVGEMIEKMMERV